MGTVNDNFFFFINRSSSYLKAVVISCASFPKGLCSVLTSQLKKCSVFVVNDFFKEIKSLKNGKELHRKVELRGSQWGGAFYDYRLKFWLFYDYRLIFFSCG